tara:strand:+ start:146 stop:844 length:699 start_codon:yes stop_codon:yes gene_type:complete
MIAPAMNSRTDGALTYQSLGQRKALVERVVRSEEMSRLGQECSELGDLQVKLNFDRDARYRVVVEGVIEASAKIACHLCRELVPFNLRTTFNATIASTEEQAEYWSSSAENDDLNIVVIEGPRLDIVELVEDELLLDLPGQVCSDLACVNRPSMVYDEGASSDLEEQPRQKDAQEDASHKALKDKALKDKVLKEKASDKTEELVDRQLPFVGLKAALQELGSLQAQKGEDEA